MPGVGKLEPFDVGTTSWDEYQERVEQFFIANDVEDIKSEQYFSPVWDLPRIHYCGTCCHRRSLQKQACQRSLTN